MNEKTKEFFTLHEAHQHAMQTGVSLREHRKGEQEATKHLRVGINTAMSDHAGLVELLVAKGIISEEEYAEAITKTMEAEHRRYEGLLGVKIG